ncbi:MAG: methylmalonyl Co-A mutase-associated GTPase MeaB [candidate division NC10 bacterium]|nr:methylmalonyl Co-A mutase-associated GTPase MeaB [candidate division NC10 bacterium]
MDELVNRVLHGEYRAAARLMTLIEGQSVEALAAMKRLYSHTGQAELVGITGPPGSGKSTLADKLTEEFRRIGKTVGIVAVDPTSPFTGGAILADRLRMQRHSLDPGVFIRSMATRGHLGGLARATNDVVNILDAMGKDLILIETVGVGQDEVEVVKTAYTSVVVTVPGLGDEIQALKAGIMEIADLFVVNKADREGADRTYLDLEIMLDQSPFKGGWRPPIYKTVATEGKGVKELAEGIVAHQAYMGREGLRDQKATERVRALFQELLRECLTKRALERISINGTLDFLYQRMARRELDPYSAAEEVLKRVGL